MERSTNTKQNRALRNKKRNARVAIALSAVTLLAMGGPFVLTKVRAVSSLVAAKISGAVHLERYECEQLGSSNLSALVNSERIRLASGVKVGDELLPLDLDHVEKKILSIPWIRTVQVKKQLPANLIVRYSLHQARAIVPRQSKPWIVSDTLEWIAPYKKMIEAQTPTFSGVDLPVLVREETLVAELSWLEALEKQFTVHEVSVGNDGRVSAIVELKYTSHSTKVVVVGFGNPHLHQLERLRSVASYLVKNNIIVSSIDLRGGKKVVVNIGKRS